MLFKTTIAVYCDIHKKHVSTKCGQNAEYLYIPTSGKYNNQCFLKF
jgi:hypothetical protein